jgi:GT2 family glycosyltransferase
MPDIISVAIPTLDAGPRFGELLTALGAQRVDGEVELVVCDSGSRDATVTLAAGHGARVITIDRAHFSHGETRNRLMRETHGDHVAFLTQDAVPAHDGWLAGLLGAFTLAPDVGLVFGPYRPRPDASPMVARELDHWFGSLSPGGEPRVDLPRPGDRTAAPGEFYGARGYFTDANGCLARAAWEQVPFRDVPYAEDHVLAQDMLRAGFAKVFVPTAAVVHSHDYTPAQWLRRSFDEARAIQATYGVDPAGDARTALRNLRGNVGADWRAAGRSPTMLVRSAAHHGARTAGAFLGAHAAGLPGPLTAQLSLEGRR